MLTFADWRHFPVQKKFKAWCVILLSGLYFFYEFIQMNMFNSLNDTFQVTFALNAMQVGLVSAFYFLADSILLYPVGSILDKVSSKKMIIIGMMMCILGTLMIASASNSWFLVCARFMAGLAAAFCLLSVLRLGTQYFPAEKMGQVSGAVVTLGMLGGAVSQAPLTWLIQVVGWRHALYDVAFLGMGILLFIWLFAHDVAKGESFTNFRLASQSQQGRPLKIIIKNKHNWLNSLYVATMNLPIMILAGLFGTNFMAQGYGFNTLKASTISMMIFIGTIVGSTILGWLSDYFKERRRLMRICAWISLFLFAFILFGTKLSYQGYLLVFFLLGLITAAQVISYPVAQELNPRRLSGATLGFVSVFIMAIPMVLQPLTGWIMDLVHQGPVGAYQLRDYQYGLSILLLGFIVSIICAYLLPETYGMTVDE